MKGQDDPINGRFDIYKLKMSKLSSAIVKEYCRNMFFMNFETHIEYKKGLEKNRLKGGRIRNIHTIRTPQYEAKCRTKGIAETMVFNEGANPYADFIGTNLMNQSTDKANKAFEAIKTSLTVTLGECKDMKEVGELWRANASIHKCKEAIVMFKEFKEVLKEREQK